MKKGEDEGKQEIDIEKGDEEEGITKCDNIKGWKMNQRYKLERL